MDADREVMHYPEVHSRIEGAALRGLKLLVAQPLQPLVKLDPVLERTALRFDELRIRPLGSAGRKGFGERTPQGKTLQPLAFLSTEGVELLLPFRGPRYREDRLQRL